jgi:aquaporin NIP
MEKTNYTPQFLAEFVGTFLLVFIGCGSVILSQVYNLGWGGATFSLAFGVAVSLVIYSAVGRISGAHINPAVSIALWLNEKFPVSQLIGFIAFQVLGAIAASYTQLLIWGPAHSFGATSISVSLEAGILIEFAISFALMFSILVIVNNEKTLGNSVGLLIGLVVAILAFIAGPHTGASMNPARTIGPALVSGQFTHLWVYCLLPVLGTASAVLCYKFLVNIKTQAILFIKETIQTSQNTHRK